MNKFQSKGPKEPVKQVIHFMIDLKSGHDAKHHEVISSNISHKSSKFNIVEVITHLLKSKMSK